MNGGSRREVGAAHAAHAAPHGAATHARRGLPAARVGEADAQWVAEEERVALGARGTAVSPRQRGVFLSLPDAAVEDGARRVDERALARARCAHQQHAHSRRAPQQVSMPRKVEAAHLALQCLKLALLRTVAVAAVPAQQTRLARALASEDTEPPTLLLPPVHVAGHELGSQSVDVLFFHSLLPVGLSLFFLTYKVQLGARRSDCAMQ